MRTTLKIEFNLNKIVFTEERLQNSDYFAEDFRDENISHR
jgi:hypothetical protein